MYVLHKKPLKAESFLKRKGLLNQILAKKGPGPEAWNLNHEKQG